MAFDAVGRKGLQHHFGVGMPPKFDSARFEFGPQVLEIIDFTVVCDDKAAVGGDHRLMTGGRKVDNREAAMGKCEACVSIAPNSVIIGTAVGETVRHRNRVAFELIA